MGPYLRPDVPTLCGDLLDTGVFAVLPFLLCMLCHCRLTKNSFTEPHYMGCGMPKGIRSCAPQIFALHQFSKHHRVGSHLFSKKCQRTYRFFKLSADAVALNEPVDVVLLEKDHAVQLIPGQLALLAQTANHPDRCPEIRGRVFLGEPELVDASLGLGDGYGMVKPAHHAPPSSL